MAGIENLKNKIVKDNEEKVLQLLQDAKNRSDEIVKKAEDKAKLMTDEALLKAEKDGSDSKERIIARAQLDGRNMILSAKQEMIDRVLKLAEDRISSMGKVEYTNFIERLLLLSVETGEEEIIFSSGDKMRINPELVSNVNSKLSSTGKKGELRISDDTRNIKNGFILKQGGIEINCSIESQIRTMRDSIEGEIANLLFKDI